MPSEKAPILRPIRDQLKACGTQTNDLTDLARESPVNKSTHAIGADDKLTQKRRIQTAVDRDVGTSCDNRNEAENQHTC